MSVPPPRRNGSVNGGCTCASPAMPRKPTGMMAGSPSVHTTTAPLVRRSPRSIHGARLGIAVDQHARLLARVVGDIAAVPHVADHIGERRPGGGTKAARQLVREPVAGKEDRAIAMIDPGQHGIARDERERKKHEHRRPDGADAGKARRLDGVARREHDPEPEEQPERIAPHRDGAASGERGQSRGRQRRTERQERHDPPVEGIGRRSATGAFGRGQITAAAIAIAGSMKANWLTTKTIGCQM